MFRPATSPPHLATLVFLTAMSVLTLNMFVPALASIAKSFNTDYAIANLAIAGYLAITAFVQLIAGPLSDRFGRRPILLGSMTLFVIASIGCTFATDIWTFLAFRVLQSAVVTGSVLSSAIVRDMVGKDKTASLLGYISMAMAIAPMIAPVIGGILDGIFGWRSNFWAYVGFGIIALALVWMDVGETNTRKSNSMKAQIKTYPLLLKAPLFWGNALAPAFGVGAFFSFIAGAPMIAPAVFGISAPVLGLYLGSITAGFATGSFLSGRYATRVRITSIMLTGRIIACVALIVALGLSWMGIETQAAFFGPILFVGMANGLTTPGAYAGVVSVRPELAGSASGLVGALTLGTGAVLTSLTGALLVPETGVPTLLIIMFLTSTASLCAVLYVRANEPTPQP
jgi:DHA1 family bicyclomycin/chloramphenicol resistance-like MFS transporter